MCLPICVPWCLPICVPTSQVERRVLLNIFVFFGIMLVYNAVVLPSVTQQVVIRAAAGGGGAVVLVVVLVEMCIWVHSVTADIFSRSHPQIHYCVHVCILCLSACLPACLSACLPASLLACLKQPACLSLALPIVGGASVISVHLVYLSGSVCLLLADLLSACICLVLCQPAPACQPARAHVSLLHARSRHFRRELCYAAYVCVCV